MYYQRKHWMVPGRSLDHVTRHRNMIENRIDSCDEGKLCLVSGTWLKTDSCHESKLCLDSFHVFFRISFFKKMFIYFTYLTAPGLGWSMQACWSLLQQTESLVIVKTLSCGMWDLVPWSGIEPGLLALGIRTLDHKGSSSLESLFIIIKYIASPHFPYHHTHVQSCLILCDSMDHSPPGSSVHGILKTRIMKWVDVFFSRGSSWPRDWARVLA